MDVPNSNTVKGNKNFHFFKFFGFWLSFLIAIFFMYAGLEQTTADKMYLNGFYNHDIYITLFSSITFFALLISQLCSYFFKDKPNYIVACNLFVFVCYLAFYGSVPQYQLENFNHPSVAIREQFSGYAFVSVLALAITAMSWSTRYWYVFTKAKVPIWVTVLFTLATSLLFLGWWLFMYVISIV